MKPNVSGPESKPYRYIILILVCLTMYSNCFIFDQPALLKEEILQEFEPIYGPTKTSLYFSFLYSLYSIPNIVLPLIGGFLSDIFGYRKMSILFLLFIMLGQCVLYIGSAKQELKLMIFGRFLFGLGGESIGITTSIIMVKWFAGQELSFANALNLSFIRSATVLNTLISPRIAEFKGMTYAFGFGAALCIMSFISLLVLNGLDANEDRKEMCRKQKKDGVLDNSEPVIDLIELKNQIITDIMVFPNIFWIMTLLMTTFYTSVLIFISFSSTMIIELWLPNNASLEENQKIAGDLMSIPYMCCTFFSPFVGYMIDKVGQRIKIMIVACVLVFLGLASMLMFFPTYTMLLLGIAYALFGATIWTSITYVVQQKHLGTAYGVMNSIQNFAFFLMPLFIAVISTEGSSQVSVVLFFLILATVSLIVSIYLYIEDRDRGISMDCPYQDKLMNFLNQAEDCETNEEEQVIEAQ